MRRSATLLYLLGDGRSPAFALGVPYLSWKDCFASRIATVTVLVVV